MSDIVVTVPKNFKFNGLKGLAAWVDEGDPAGSEWSGIEWHFYLGSRKPAIEPDERVYIVYNGLLRGYAPLVRLDYDFWDRRYSLVRHGNARGVTIPEPIQGFRGFRYRWWDRKLEVGFENWDTCRV